MGGTQISIELIEVNFEFSQDSINYACLLFKKFWKEHNDSIQKDKEAWEDFKKWSSLGNLFLFGPISGAIYWFCKIGKQRSKN